MPLRRADDRSYTLAVNASATSAPVNVPGGEYMFYAEGNLSSGVLSLESQAPNGSWFTVQVFTGSLVRFTSLPGSQTAIALPAGSVRISITGGGTPSGINAFLVGLG